jgi:hypothetical protein
MRNGRQRDSAEDGVRWLIYIGFYYGLLGCIFVDGLLCLSRLIRVFRLTEG